MPPKPTGPSALPLESRKYLFDIAQAGTLIGQFLADRTLTHYQNDPYLRSAIERQLEIIGEAVSQLSKRDPSLAAKIPEHRRLIAFRNVLVHGYADIDHRLVWGLLETKLPELLTIVHGLSPPVPT